jgi:4-hydroxy-tetrahydrodipicolinate reductase
MKIALLGYGKMGKSIEGIALEKGHEILCKSSREIDVKKLKTADVAIDFSVPEAAFQNIKTCLENGIPVVSGTTGWLEKYEEAKSICKEKNGAFLYASNFSVGVNLFFELNKKLAELTKKFPTYKPEIEETHHTAKLDAPSGTAITLAEQIIEKTDKTTWELQESGETKSNSAIPIIAKRIANVPGTHIVKYESEIDSLEIKHTAHSRQGFAMGAVMAAEWIQGKTGVFGMKDVLGFG